MICSAAVLSLLGNAALVLATSIAEINGNRYLSPLNGTTVANVKGLVTAVGKNAVYLRSTTPDDDPATSESLYVYTTALQKQVKVGDIVTLSGTVDEYRSNKDYIYQTELSSPKNVVVVSSGNKVAPLVIGLDTSAPPTAAFSSLDEGDIFAVPNGVNRVSTSNPELDPSKYGLDFWESLQGELVTVKNAYQISRPNTYGEVWVRGDWQVTGLNGHGGLTMLDGDANPEAITIGTPLDGTKNPSDSKMGDYIGDVTGIVSNQFGFYRVLPLTNITVLKNATADYGAVGFTSEGTCRGITVADYNAENLTPTSDHLPKVVQQIVHKLLTPDLIFLQEVQDNDGSTNDGVTSANLTLSTLVSAIADESGGAAVYEWASVDPVNNQDGGEPGGNIRNAYLYRPDVVKLYRPNQGGSLDANEVIDGPALKYNPGRIDPANEAWASTRKPLVAQWKTMKGMGKTFFTVNVHMTSKGGSSSLEGDLRPPVNKGVEKRDTQNEVAAAFIAQILAKDPNARIITAGDFNEYAQVEPVRDFVTKSGLVDLEDGVGMPPAERYTYLYDMNCESLDHIFVSPSIVRRAQYEHLHLNTWQNYDGQVSDHDPSVAKLNLCGCGA